MLGRLLCACSALALVACAGLPGAGPEPAESAALASALDTLGRDPAAGEAELHEFLRRWPQSPLASDARLQLGELALARGELDVADDHFEAVLLAPRDRTQQDRARLGAARVALRRGDPRAAERLLAPVRVSRLDAEDRYQAHRALADSAPDEVTRLRRLAALRALDEAPDAEALVDVEIDRVISGMDPRDLERAAEQLGSEIPAARVWLRRAELALEAGDADSADRYLERARSLPDAPGYAGRMELDRERPEAREEWLSDSEALPTFSELRDVPLPAMDAAEGVLGVALPLSGPLAEFGEETLQGILLATGAFEAEGPRMRVVIRDTRGRPDGAAEAVRDLAERDVSAIVGPLAAAECEAAAVAAEGAGVPLLTLTAREEIATNRAHVLRLRTMPREEVEALVGYAMDEAGADAFAILYPNDAYGRGLRDLFWDAVERRGGEIVGVARYEPDATDFAGPIRSLLGYDMLSAAEKAAIARREGMLQRARRLPAEKAAALRAEARRMTGPDGAPLPPVVDFDALFIPESHEKVVLIAPQLAFHEAVGMRLLGPSAWHHPDLVPIGRHHVNGALFTAQFFAESELASVREFGARYRETYAQEPEAFAAQGYDAAALVLAQLAEGHRSREDLRQGLLEVRGFPGVTGVLSMRADGNARKRPFLLAVERGEVIQVEGPR